MPFATSFDPVFAATRTGASSAVPEQSIDCYWLKDQMAAGRITDDILDGLQHSAFCIADLTGNNPNVMWETGYAMALGKPTILIGQNVETIPFDLKIHRVLPYEINRLDLLATQLAESVRQTLGRYELPAQTDPVVRPFRRSMSIVVTGTSNAEKARTVRRVETILQPYIDGEYDWYCGTSGVSDEVILEYLLSHGKRPVAVGYNRYDFTRAVRKLIEKEAITFVDASVETIPRTLSGPSERDILFASKADLVVLFWDGKSSGTRELVEFFKSNGISTITAFI
jgi:nucleoside 2-deoxyribosyltransferase